MRFRTMGKLELSRCAGKGRKLQGTLLVVKRDCQQEDP